jgi:preprotein translocase subunit YajC
MAIAAPADPAAAVVAGTPSAAPAAVSTAQPGAVPGAAAVVPGAPAVAPGAPLAQTVPAGDGMTIATQPAKEKPAGGCGGENPMFSFLLLGVMFVVFYLFLIRPQQKRQKELQSMLNALTKGDRVITSGGMLGTIVAITDQIITLDVGNKTTVKVLRSHVQGKQASLSGEVEGKKSNDKESKESDS